MPNVPAPAGNLHRKLAQPMTVPTDADGAGKPEANRAGCLSRATAAVRARAAEMPHRPTPQR